MSVSSWKTLKKKLICAKCNNTFQNPKVLPCLDLICADCLKDLLSRISPNPSGYKKDVQCPQCKLTVSVPLKVEDLVSDVSTERLVQVLSSKANLRCQNCCTDAPPFAICSVCRLILCKACTEAHKRALRTQQHELLLVDEMRSSTGSTPTVLIYLNKMKAALSTPQNCSLTIAGGKVNCCVNNVSVASMRITILVRLMMCC